MILDKKPWNDLVAKDTFLAEFYFRKGRIRSNHFLGVTK
jgi:hypothetical protein